MAAGYRGGFNPFRDAQGRWATSATHGRSFLDADGHRLPPTAPPEPAPRPRPDVPSVMVMRDGNLRYDFHDPRDPTRDDALYPFGFRLTPEDARPPAPGDKPVYEHEGYSAHLRGNRLVFFDAEGHPVGDFGLTKSQVAYNGYAVAAAVKKQLATDAAEEVAQEATRDRSPGAPRQIITADDADAYLAEMAPAARRLTKAQIDALREYQACSGPLNESLRTGTPMSEEDRVIDTEMRGLIRPTTEAIRVYRGMNASYLKEPIEVGSEISDKGWGSTSVIRSTAMDYSLQKGHTYAARGSRNIPSLPGLFEITLPKGTPHAPLVRPGKGMYQMPVGSGSRLLPMVGQPGMKCGEVALPPGTRYRVTGVRQETQGTGRQLKTVTVYSAEVIADGE